MFTLFQSKKKEKILDAFLASPMAQNVLAEEDRDRGEQRAEVIRQLAEAAARHTKEANATAAKLEKLGPQLEASRKNFLEIEREAFLTVGAMMGESCRQQTEISRLHCELVDLASQPLSDLLAGIGQALNCALSKNVMELGALDKEARSLLFEPAEDRLLAKVEKLRGQLDEYTARLLRP